MKRLLLFILCCTLAIRSNATEKEKLERAITQQADNRLKAGLYEKLAVYWADKNPDSAIHYFGNSLDCAGKVGGAFLEKSLIQYTRFLFGFGALDIAQRVNNNYLDSFKAQQQQNGMATAFANLGLISLFQGDNNNAFKHFSNAAKFCSEDNKGLRVIINSQLGTIYSHQGKYGESLKLLQSTLLIADSVNNPTDYQGIIFSIGNIYAAIGDHKTALGYFQRVAEKMKQQGDDIGLANCYANISAAYSNLNNLEEAEKYGRITLSLVTNSNPSIVANVLISLSDVLIKRHKLEEATVLLNRLDTIATATNDPLARSWTEMGRGSVLFEEKKYPESIRHLLTALPLVEEGADLQEMRSCYSLLYKNYEQIKDYPNAFNWLSKHTAINDSISSESKIKELTLLQSKLENEKREAIIHKEKQRQVVIRNSLIGLSIALLIISLLILNRQRLKHQNRQQRLLAEKQLAEQELQNATEQLNEIGRNVREKNELIEKAAYEINTARQEIQQLKNQPAAPIPTTADTHETDLLILQESILLTNQDWDRFANLFEKVHPGFFSRLKLKMPTLSPAETRFLALCKLKYAPKDMAAMLGIGKDAIRQYRSRLKKKLNLPDEVSFEEMAENI
jgi:tetratricopeptide (TPR) repeat protein